MGTVAIIDGTSNTIMFGEVLAKPTGHAIVSPRDAASGLATGRRQHKPLVLTFSL